MGGNQKKCFKIFPKDSHHDMQIKSRHHADYECILETRTIQFFTSIHAHKLTAKVWNLPGWDELGWKKYDPNSFPTFCLPEPRHMKLFIPKITKNNYTQNASPSVRI